VSGAAVAAWRARAAAPGAVLLDGFHALKHALRFDADIALAVAADKPAALELARALAPELTDRLAALLEPVTSEQLRALVPRPHPTGIAALAARRPGGLSESAPVVVLDEPRHLGNIGAVIRVAAGAGAGGVITTGLADPWHPNAVRAAAGLHFATAVERRAPGELPPWPLYALDPEGEDIRAVRVPDRALLAFGSERAGLSAALRERADHLLALPMRPGVSSYNLATSVAMTLFHWMSR
jgi:TrmH family RNA methyltransferase